MKSIWENTVERISFPKLDGDVKTDVLIIGGGITGILCGYILKEKGIDCIISEKDRICCKTTENTTAKITFQHGLIYDKIIKNYGLEAAELYLDANKKALDKYRDLSQNADCDFSRVDSFVYSLNNREKIEREIKAFEKIGQKAELVENLPIPISVAAAVKIENQAQFNPLRLIFSLTKGMKIFENTEVLEILTDGAITKNGKIKAEKIIVATHFPFINKYGGYFLKMYQHRSYVLALENAPNVNGIYVDEADKGMSFRNYKNFLLLGGGGHRTGKKGGCYNEISNFAKLNFLGSKVVSRWATQDCMTLDGIPYIGAYSRLTPNLYAASGFNKWGMTSAMVSAIILSDLAEGKPCKYAKVFSPQRSVLHPQLAINIAESAVGLLTPTAPRCSHLGCALKYNKIEHSWDCSCHGSRYDQNGKILNNPATENKTFD